MIPPMITSNRYDLGGMSPHAEVLSRDISACVAQDDANANDDELDKLYGLFLPPDSVFEEAEDASQYEMPVIFDCREGELEGKKEEDVSENKNRCRHSIGKHLSVSGTLFDISQEYEDMCGFNSDSDMDDTTINSDVTDFTLRHVGEGGSRVRPRPPSRTNVAPEPPRETLPDLVYPDNCDSPNNEDAIPTHLYPGEDYPEDDCASVLTEDTGWFSAHRYQASKTSPDNINSSVLVMNNGPEIEWDLEASREFDVSRRNVSNCTSTGTIGDSDKKRVSFHAVQVRYYERVLEINPAVSSGGAAIGIGWQYIMEEEVPINDWDMRRGARNKKSRELVIPRHVRENMLKDLGYTQQDIAMSTRLIWKTKNQRKTTIQNLSAQPMEEAVERASRRVRGMFKMRRKGR